MGDEDTAREARARWHLAARIVLSLAILGAALFTRSNYLRALIWAAVLAIALWPLFQRAVAGRSERVRREVFPLLFGALTAVAAMIPFAAAIAFLLAALAVFVTGNVVPAVIIVAAGFAVTFTADHFVRPSLIGGTTKLPFIWVLLGILGGVETFGLLGLFLGPAIMAVLILLWRELAGEGNPARGARVAFNLCV